MCNGHSQVNRLASWAYRDKVTMGYDSSDDVSIF
jgi:hypothetical protein